MAEDRVESREISWRQLLPWTELFKGFQVALDLNKMLLAALGILAMSVGWWVLSLPFYASYSSLKPWSTGELGKAEAEYVRAREDRMRWNLMHEAINLDAPGADPSRYALDDVAETLPEYDQFKKLFPDEGVRPGTGSKLVLDELAALEKAKALTAALVAQYRARAPLYDRVGSVKPAGRLSTMPWSEDRGPNPYLLATSQTGRPWEPGHFWEWFASDQAPVMIEPLLKFVRPIVYFLSPGNDFTSRTFFLLTALVMLVTWAVFGGAITRIAAVQYARGERIGMIEALRFSMKRLLDYVLAPVFPIGFVFVLAVFLWLFGFFFSLIPVVGDILIAGLFWPFAVVMGLIMAVALVGLVGWPLMAATISTEGTDSWEAVSRSYSYVYQRPWNFIWYTLVAVAYGGVVVFFVGFMASFSVYLAKWGVNNGSVFWGRQPAFLFVYAPTSFGWRELLLENTRVEPTEADLKAEEAESVRDKVLTRTNGRFVVRGRTERALGEGSVGGVSRWNRIDPDAYRGYLKTLNWWNKAGAAFVGFWLGLAFLLVLGFGYSFFWAAATIMYFLLRKSVDTNELDEVYQEEDDFEASYTPPAQPAAPSGPAAPASPRTLPMVSPPPAAPAPAPAPAVTAPPPPITPPPEPAPEPPQAPPAPPPDGPPPA